MPWRRGRVDGGLASRLLGEAREALDDDDAARALRLADQALRGAGRDLDGELRGDLLAARAEALGELGRWVESLRSAVEACELLADDAAAWWCRATAAYRTAEFEEAALGFTAVTELAPDDAAAWSALGRAALWTGERAVSDRAFRRAAELDPRHHVVPLRIAAVDFDRIAGQVWRSIPPEFAARMGNTMVVVEELPDADEVAEGLDPDVLGVYSGGTALAGEEDYPQRIVLYQRNHENLCARLGQLHEEIRRTILHEVGHHFGMSHHELPY